MADLRLVLTTTPAHGVCICVCGACECVLSGAYVCAWLGALVQWMLLFVLLGPVSPAAAASTSQPTADIDDDKTERNEDG